jgi:hypothetical protein
MGKMDILDYLELSDEEQWEELWESGVHLENFKSIDCAFVLYSLHSFFLEVELDLEGKISGKHPFRAGTRLDKYVLEL